MRTDNAAEPRDYDGKKVSALCHISTDYYARIEQERGDLPSEHLIGVIAQGLRTSRLDERTTSITSPGLHPGPAADL